ncbi:hypothetical protein ACLKA6_013146 [Drosophila palustris]
MQTNSGKNAHQRQRQSGDFGSIVPLTGTSFSPRCKKPSVTMPILHPSLLCPITTHPEQLPISIIQATWPMGSSFSSS